MSNVFEPASAPMGGVAARVSAALSLSSLSDSRLLYALYIPFSLLFVLAFFRALPDAHQWLCTTRDTRRRESQVTAFRPRVLEFTRARTRTRRASKPESAAALTDFTLNTIMPVAVPKQNNPSGIKAYYQAKIEAAELLINQKTQNLRRLEAQRNALNARGMYMSSVLNV